MNKEYTHLIIGSGIIGLAMARAIFFNQPKSKIIIIDKEKTEGCHASGRNSGVLHSGFYYTSDSLKAKFTVEGNRHLKEFCRQHHIPVNECGKLVVAQNEDEVETLYELERRGQKNGCHIKIIEEAQARELEPNVKTHQKALYAPDTASVDPLVICQTLKNTLFDHGVEFSFDTKYLSHRKNVIQTDKGEFHTAFVINCAGLYADRIARDFGFGQQYTILPFKGLYLKYTKNTTDIRMNIYPVPNLKNPFLGVHFTKTVTGQIKIGPTAIPVFWREQYDNSRFKWDEFWPILGDQTRLLITNAFGFRDLSFEEIKKYNKDYFIRLAQNMVLDIDPKGFSEYTLPGIRAQLLNKKSFELVQDFIIEGDHKSVHILNAVSPAFTCALPFSEYVLQKYLPKV